MHSIVIVGLFGGSDRDVKKFLDRFPGSGCRWARQRASPSYPRMAIRAIAAGCHRQDSWPGCFSARLGMQSSHQAFPLPPAVYQEPATRSGLMDVSCGHLPKQCPEFRKILPCICTHGSYKSRQGGFVARLVVHDHADFNPIHDADPAETTEWREAFLALTPRSGGARACFMLDELARLARTQQIPWQPELNTPYVNTIPA